MRKPVMAYIFETPWTTTSFEASPVLLREVVRVRRLLAVEDEPVVEVVHHQPEVLLLAEGSTISATKSAEYMTPDGLFGLLRMIAFVYEPTLSAMSGTEGWKLPSSGSDRHRHAARELHHLGVAHPVGRRDRRPRPSARGSRRGGS